MRRKWFGVMVAGTGVLAIPMTLAACGGQTTKASTASSTMAARLASARCPAGTPEVRVEAQGTAQGPPDQVTINLGVETRAATAAASMEANAAKATALIRMLKAHGVAAKDIQTSGLSVTPDYSSSGEAIIGYQVDNDVTVTLHAVASAGTIIDDAAKAAGNAVRVNNIAFSLSDDTALADEARAQAVRKGRSHAKAMAAAAGMSLGGLCSLTDHSVSQSPPIYAVPFDAARVAGAPSTPVQAGSQTVTADVSAVYQLLPSSAASSS